MNNLDKNLNFLNKHQLEAVKKTNGSLLVLAGAGSGKTSVLILKIYYILISKLAMPNQILAVTFTNKAANEMKLRITKMINNTIEGWWIGTFHSISAKILRRHSEKVGLKNNFVIIDSEDQIKLIKSICELEKINLNERSPKYFLSCIEKYKNDYLTSEDAISKANSKEDKIISNIYSIYENELIRLNCCDFGNLIIHCLNIFKKDKRILTNYQNQFKYILVDEYQDINYVQQQWLKYLYNINKNICCVGDDDQSIYSWRGAEIKNILSFEKTFENSSIIRLEQNYRSTKRILNCASNLIKYNKNRYGKTLWSNNNSGDKIIVRGFLETKEEAIYISNKIEELKKRHVSFNEIAILMRVAAHTRSFEERFLNIGLPYRIVGGIKFYERKEIKDLVAYLRVVSNFNDDLALERIINIPKRGIGKTTLQKIHLISRKNKIPLLEGCELYLKSKERNKSKFEISEFITKIYKWNKLKDKISHIELCDIVLDDSGYKNFIINEGKQKDNIDNYDRLDNINEFINSLKEFENLQGFLEHISLVSENENNNDNNKINLITMHSAKGLEFDYVFLVGWEEGVFPSKRSIEEKGSLGLEEERRLAYVALTRARKNIFISFVNQNRYIYASHDYNRPSSFINELPKEELVVHNSEVLHQGDDDFHINQIEENDSVKLTPGRERLIKFYENSEDNFIDFNQDFNKSSKLNYKEGERVFHNKFGYGRILEIDHDTALINFEKSGTKMIYLKFLSKDI